MSKQHISNDKFPIFSHLMGGYWNQTAPGFYENFRACLVDFEEMEGEKKFDLLKTEISILIRMKVFPNNENISSFYDMPFWRNFTMMLREEDLASNFDILELR